MKKLLLLMLFVVALNQTTLKAQCPPGAFAYQSLYPQCPSGCGVLLLGWPEGVLVNIYGGTPLTIITSALISGTLGGGGTGDAFTCVPCNTPLVYASNVIGATGGCVIATIGVVPVKLSNFTAIAANNNCILKWNTTSESGPVKYIIQRSENGRNFTDISTVEGISLPSNAYTYTDVNSIKGSSYYRIKTIEFSGSTAYSDIVMVRNDNDLVVSVYPNPSSNDFKITVPAKFLPAHVEIINGQGTAMHAEKINQTTLTVHRPLPKGIYILKVTGNNNNTVTQRLIKN
jgi:hypothetical protein